MIESSDVWLANAKKVVSPHFDSRECSNIDLLVIHNISLPPANRESDFDNQYVEAFFQGTLDHDLHPYFDQIRGVRVSAHLYIKRTGELIQFVPLNERAWHAGLSEFDGRTKCNDFSIGIEMQGADYLPFTDVQYNKLIEVTKQICSLYPNISKERIVGHSDIAPGRKTDPGEFFNWKHYLSNL